MAGYTIVTLVTFFADFLLEFPGLGIPAIAGVYPPSPTALLCGPAFVILCFPVFVHAVAPRPRHHLPLHLLVLPQLCTGEGLRGCGRERRVPPQRVRLRSAVTLLLGCWRRKDRVHADAGMGPTLVPANSLTQSFT